MPILEEKCDPLISKTEIKGDIFDEFAKKSVFIYIRFNSGGYDYILYPSDNVGYGVSHNIVEAKYERTHGFDHRAHLKLEGVQDKPGYYTLFSFFYGKYLFISDNHNLPAHAIYENYDIVEAQKDIIEYSKFCFHYIDKENKYVLYNPSKRKYLYISKHYIPSNPGYLIKADEKINDSYCQITFQEILFTHEYADKSVFQYYQGGKVLIHYNGNITYYKSWSDEWNRFCGYEFNGEKFVLIYNKGKGAVILEQLISDMTNNIEVWKSNWNSDWETLNVEISSSKVVLKLVSSSGKIERYLLSKTGITNLTD